MTAARPKSEDGFLAGVRVLELGGELVEFAGKMLAGLGADVIKVEPPEGEITRTYGPFNGDEPGRENSLYFWHYNFGKRGVTLNLDSAPDRERFLKLAESAAVVLDGRPLGYMSERGLGYEDLKKINPGIIVMRVSPFGDTGPWAGYKGSDLVHLALGGVMMNCGYDADPSGFFETPPIAPQMWQAYQITGDMTLMGVLGALYHRSNTGQGQALSTSVHGCVSQQTEGDMPAWLYVKQTHYRRTCRHSRPVNDSPVIALTKDGRWQAPYRSYASAAELKPTVEVLAKYGMAEDLLEPKYSDAAYLAKPEVDLHIVGVLSRFVNSFMFDREIWRELQDAGQTWAPVRRPEENTTDAHWLARDTFFQVERPELGRTFTEIGAKWYCEQVPWRRGPRSPLLGEHNDAVLRPLAKVPSPTPVSSPNPTPKRHKPRALDGVKFVDLGWLVASAGAGRFISAMGAQVIKVEHKSRWDGLRYSPRAVAPASRKERENATAPLENRKHVSPNCNGFFMDINAGKRAISLNVKHPEAKKILAKLLESANVVAEGYSPGTMDRMGFGYNRLKEINPGIVYVQQSGMGQHGVYGQMRSYGPVAQAFSGLSDMSGLPEPFPPAGIGYSYLDWCAAYSMANAILAGIYRQKMTGEGCWIDASQVEVGIYMAGTTVLNHSANGHRWSRYGNRSPYKLAAPSGAYRTKGNDRWVAISCFTEEDWRSLLRVLGNPAWGKESKFATRAQRLVHQDALDVAVNISTASFEPYVLMQALQAAGVAAGVCQNAEDRAETDPQLKALNWLVELKQTDLGTWPCKDFPVTMSETPAHIGSPINRHGPNYAEDNELIYGEWLGYSPTQLKKLEEEGVI